jgi:serine/threonine protein phosphatase PrpC
MITANPDIVEEELSKDINFIVIACDGIWDCMTNQECCDFISERLKKNPNINLSKIIEEMFDSIIASDIYSGKIINNIELFFILFYIILSYFIIILYIFFIFSRKWSWM